MWSAARSRTRPSPRRTTCPTRRSPRRSPPRHFAEDSGREGGIGLPMGGDSSLEQRLDDVERLVRTLVARISELELDRGAPAPESAPPEGSQGAATQSAPAAPTAA